MQIVNISKIPNFVTATRRPNCNLYNLINIIKALYASLCGRLLSFNLPIFYINI